MIPLESELPEGAELTLAELREMAARQQQQIEAQQQLLVAKEQRLKFLKQQEACHHSSVQAQEAEHLHHLREKVEAQELKLRRLRALRGQVDQQKVNNGNLSSELDSIRALFNEKEKELSVAVAKVEELTRQLEELRHGNLNCIPNSTALNMVPATLELDKLKRELMYRTKLNDQQNARIAQQREKLEQRQGEISCIDERIAELQQRLQRKRMLNQQLVNQIHAATLARQAQMRPNQCKTRFRPLSANIATVEPLRRVPQEQERSQDDMITKLNKNNEDYLEFAPNKNDPKYQTLPYNTKFSLNKNNCDAGGKTVEMENGGKTNEDLTLRGQNLAPPAPLLPPSTSCPSYDATVSNQSQSGIPSVANRTHTAQIPPPPKLLPPPCLTNFAPRPYAVSRSQPVCSGPTPSTLHITTSNSRGNANTRDFNSSSVTNRNIVSPNSAPSSRSKVPIAVSTTIRQVQDHVSPTMESPMSEVKNMQHPTSQNSHSPVQMPPQWVRSSSDKNSAPCNQSAENANCPQLNSKPILPPKPSLPIKPVPPPRQTHMLGTSAYADTSPEALDSALCVLKNSSSNSSGSSRPFGGYRYRVGSSFGPGGHVGSANSGTFSQKESDHSDATPISSAEVNVPNSNDNHGDKDEARARTSGGQKPDFGSELCVLPDNFHHGSKRLTVEDTNGPHSAHRDQSLVNSDHGSVPNVHVTINRRIEMPPSFLFPETLTPLSSKLSVKDADRGEQRDSSEKNQEGLPSVNVAEANSTWNSHAEWADETDPQVESPVTIQNCTDEQVSCSKDLSSSSLSSDQSSPERGNDTGNNEDEDGLSPTECHSAALRRVKKGNLKSKGSAKNTRRVSFDPLALLLDAALEGELELVKKTAREVPNPSAENDEGITALHNAICAGHFEIVKFLVEFGCDVNAQDSDGWTPLHCAASCNNLPMVKFLVEHGACIFATTLSDHETAAEKCEEDEEGFDGCSEYLYSVQEKLGILSGGAVYAVYDYDAQNADELSFKDGDLIIVLRKGDEMEREWWWSKLKDQEGYVPRNLLGLYPRVTARKDQ